MFLITSLAEAGWELGECVNSAELRRQQRVLAARHVPHFLPGMKPLWLRAADLDGAGSTASNRARLLSQSPSRTLCFHGLGKQTEGRSDKKVILLLTKKL